ncbi:MAG TPA: DUF1015 domain-containing protein [bacterium]|jgi:uncharacterized protein (DUF1015 family)
MAKIAPFVALRYDQSAAGDINKLVTQPYDKIDRALQVKYYERHPYNIVRVILSDESVADKETPYPGAGKTLREWVDKGLLKNDAQPAIYVYYQTFKFRGQTYTRKGFIASVELEEKGVRAHEHTLAGPKADRLRLLRATETNDENIFMLFSDPQNESVKIMDAAIAGQKPLIEAVDDFGETHKVWAITDPATVAKLQALVAPKELFIADGHHRFETAVNYKNECLAKGWKPEGSQGFDHRMMALFPMEDPGLVIFPTHRLVKNVSDFSTDKLLAALSRNFEIEPVKSADELTRKMENRNGKNVFGMAAVNAPAPFYFLKIKDPKVMDTVVPDASEPSRRLDVTVLHKLILENELGIDKAKLEAFTNVEYVRHTEEAMEKLGKGGIQAVFLLNPTDVKNVKDVASVGERMPQKSTDFYPKLLAGLVMMPLKIKK